MSKYLLRYTIFLIAISILIGCEQSSTPISPIESETEIPSEVANLTATIIQETTISLKWEDKASSEIGFEIFERSGSEGEFIPLMRTEANVTKVMLDKRRKAFDYCYKVRAVNKDGASGFSNEARVVGFQLASVVDGGGNLHEIEFSSDGKFIAVAGNFVSDFGDGGVAIVDAHDGNIVKVIEPIDELGTVENFCLSPNDQFVAHGMNTGTLEVWV